LSKKIIDSKSQLKAPLELVASIIYGFWISRDLSSKLAKRDLIAQYRQSILGYVWLVLLPVVNTIIWILIRKSGLLVNNGDETLPYTLYVFSGTMVFQIFSEALQTPLNEIMNSKNIISKINFPHEALISSGFIKAILNSSIRIIILMIIASFFGFYPSYIFFYFPLLLITIIFLGMAIGVVFIPLGVLFNDIQKVLPIIMQLLMFSSPVFLYTPKDKTSLLFKVFEINPLTKLLEFSRDILANAQSTELGSLWLIIAIALLTFIVFWSIYKIAIKILIERIGG
tara:strand:- start:2322 stop:3173 length:852 start_codon:yes stop_codon:yes gene_type:complete